MSFCTVQKNLQQKVRLGIIAFKAVLLNRQTQSIGGDYILRLLKYWLPPICCMALIFYLSSQSKPPLPNVDWHLVDKLYHLLEYTVLGFLVTHAFVNASSRIFRHAPWIFSFLFVILYAASDEWHQSFVPGRFVSILDWTADCIGGFLGVVSMYVWSRLS